MALLIIVPTLPPPPSSSFRTSLPHRDFISPPCICMAVPDHPKKKNPFHCAAVSAVSDAVVTETEISKNKRIAIAPIQVDPSSSVNGAPAAAVAAAGDDDDEMIESEKMRTKSVEVGPPHEQIMASVVAELNRGRSMVESLCNIGDSLITALLDPLPNSNQPPKYQLSGNFLPVSEMAPQRCLVVDGVLPPELNGVYIRNGPNAAIPTTGGCHIFDGDGMLHAVSLKDGTATYCARYVKTSRFLQESAAGRPIVPKFFGGSFGTAAGLARLGLFIARAWLGLADVSKGCGVANTSVAYFNGNILAMSEDDMPYVIRMTDNGDMETVGKWGFPNQLKFNMCAHPKVDQRTEEMFAFTVNPYMVPPVSYFRVSADGVKAPDVALPYYGDVPLIHDFAITKKYAVFPDNQFVAKPDLMQVVCKKKVPRLGILPRYATQATQMQWFDVPDCNCFHYVNAWDDGDDVVIIASFLSPPELFLDIPAYQMDCTLTEVRLNTRTCLSSTRKICSGSYEFGTFNHRRIGHSSKFVYMSSGTYPEMSAVVKIDVTDPHNPIVGRRDYGDGSYGSEPFFVPASSSYHEEKEEDDGYLLAFVHKGNGNGNERPSTELLVMDAKTSHLDVVARVKLPCRVPFGFHGCFVNQQQLAQQKNNGFFTQPH